MTTPVPVAISVSARRRPAGEHALVQTMPLEGPLVDSYGRVHNDLRISVTDRCNLRCVYCMPEEGLSFLPHKELLTFDEITRLARVAKGLGVSALRITGGEPLVRKGLPSLIERLSAIGFDDVAMTTNGTGLAKVVGALAAAGLRRVNVSCDSLRPERFAAIRRRGNLDVVLDAMRAAERAGLTPLKVNVVLLRGQNDDEIIDFASFARATGRIVRFIEFMPLDAQGQWDRSRLVPGREVFERISEVWPLEPLSESSGAAPAERFRFTDGIGEIGLISSVSEPFCGTCNRLRVTADGALELPLLRRRDDRTGPLAQRRNRCRLGPLVPKSRVGQVPRARDQRAGVSQPGPLDVDDRRLTVARLRLFGPAREAAGTASVTLPGHSVSDIIAAAEDRFGEAFSQVVAVSNVWLNGEPVQPCAAVLDADEVAVIPPVSGG